MAINFANVQLINIPEGTVKAVSSGGTVLWEADLPYRKLEYIHFNGAEYIHTDLQVHSSKYRAAWCKTDSDITSTSVRVVGTYDGNVTDAKRRYYMVANRSSGFGFAIGNKWVGGLATDYLFDQVMLYTTLGSDAKTLYYGVKSFNGATTYANGTLTADSSISEAVDLAIATNWGASGTPDLNAMFKGNFYKFIQRTTNSSGQIEYEMYPAQRRSDNVCGLYDIINHKFYPMEGTAITTAAAGPVVEEYWDTTQYRKLESIKFSGSEYMSLIKASQSHYYYAQFKPTVSDLTNGKYYNVMGAYSTSEDNIRYVSVGLNKSSSGARSSYVYSYSTSVTDIDFTSVSGVLEARWRTYDNRYNQWFCIRSGNTDHGYYNNPSASQQSNNSVTWANLSTISLMGNLGNSNWNKMVCEVYKFYIRSGDDSGTITHEMYPVQRKSDDVCGLYDEKNNVFYPMQGTNITTSAAGKLVNEFYK